MRNRQRFSMLAAACGALTLGLTACATSSHKSVRTYDYNDEGRPAPEATQTERQIDEGEYHMVAPGEMVGNPKKR